MTSAVTLVSPSATPSDERLAPSDHAFRVDREPEQLRQLADDDDQRDAVHVAVPDGLGQQVGDEPEPGQARNDAQTACEDREHPARAIASPGPRRPAAVMEAAISGASDESGPEHEDAARPEDGVGDERHDRRVQPRDRREARRLGIAHAGRDQQRREHQPGGEVAGSHGHWYRGATRAPGTHFQTPRRRRHRRQRRRTRSSASPATVPQGSTIGVATLDGMLLSAVCGSAMPAVADEVAETPRFAGSPHAAIDLDWNVPVLDAETSGRVYAANVASIIGHAPRRGRPAPGAGRGRARPAPSRGA